MPAPKRRSVWAEEQGKCMTISKQAFRTLLGSWATGVTVVTACDGDRVHGMTVSAFTEVSLEPPLVLVCADRGANTRPFIDAGGVFAVNVLAEGQEAISNRFASKKDEWRRFESLDFERGRSGAPILAGVVGSLECRVVAAHEHGDHIVYVGEVEAVEYFERPPLLYFAGTYGRFDAI